MSSPHLQPRRRQPCPSIDDVSESLGAISLRKGSTFHPSTHNESDFFNPFLRGLKPASLPSRSATCPKALEDLLIGAGERRAVELLRRVDNAIANTEELGNILSEPEVLPVPRFMVEHASLANDQMTNKQRLTAETDQHRHLSDSGIGSSIAESTASKLRNLNNVNVGSSTSAVTRSFSTTTTDTTHGLSEYSQQQIHEHIVKPILGEVALKDFHPLIKDIPRKIGSKDITTLRDLEKTLIFLAPDFSRSPAAYKSFCETSIQCLHLTVDGVHESDQCLPSDRPYSPGYFVDLVEQIRRYAAILAATRQKQKQGQEPDEMDAKPTDRIELKGGMSHNGKAGFLVRTTSDGKHISLASNQSIPSEDVASSSVKRPMEDTFTDDDGAHRSMARRKKNEPIKTYTCDQPGCKKPFKRPCDLTKHVKTHARPHKCPEEDCKYYDYGWPTEKERDRHWNDKHSDSPNVYKCLWAGEGCPYTSKRESNCKQHMEKSHGWDYVRSKNNGKGKAIALVKRPRTSATTSSTNDSVAGTPLTPAGPSPLSVSSNEMSRSDSIAPNGNTYIMPSGPTFDFDNMNFDADFSGHFNPIFLQPNPITPAWSDDRSASVGTSASPYSTFQQPGTAFEEAMINADFSSTMLEEVNFQQPTPVSTHIHDGASSSFPNSAAPSGGFGMPDNLSPHISPGAQDLTLTTAQYRDNVQMDEGFADGFGISQDFQLFASMPRNTDEPLFMDPTGFENMGSQFGNNMNHESVDLMELFPELANEH